VSGSARTPAVLGLCSFTHDSAAALISSGSLTGMAEEERLSGVKHTRDYPAGAVRWLLTEAGISAADVDIVAYNFDGYRYLGGIAGSVPYLPQPGDPLPRPAARRELRRRLPAVPPAHAEAAGSVPERPRARHPSPQGARPVRLRRVRLQRRGGAGRGQPWRDLHHLHRSGVPYRGPGQVPGRRDGQRPGFARLRLRRGDRASGLAAR
jgi:hypothetical protein